MEIFTKGVVPEIPNSTLVENEMANSVINI